MKIEAWLGVGASVVTVLAFLISPDLRRVLTADVNVATWLALLSLVSAGALGALLFRAWARRRAPAPRENIVLTRPRRMTPEDPNAIVTVGTHLVKAASGTLSLWVYLHRTGEGIRALQNNRYLFACATRFAGRYENVFAISHGPRECYKPPKDPSWKLWLADEAGNAERWTYPDGGEFAPGWHLIVVRWDHAAPVLELLIDGRKLVSETGYLHFWPKQYPDRAWVGCWPNKDPVHYANTHLARLRTVLGYMDDQWIRRELAAAPADPPL